MIWVVSRIFNFYFLIAICSWTAINNMTNFQWERIRFLIQDANYTCFWTLVIILVTLVIVSGESGCHLWWLWLSSLVTLVIISGDSGYYLWWLWLPSLVTGYHLWWLWLQSLVTLVIILEKQRKWGCKESNWMPDSWQTHHLRSHISCQEWSVI